MKVTTRFKIIGVEVVGVGALLLFLVAVELGESNLSQIIQNFAWVYAFVGVALILVGLETLFLIRLLPAQIDQHQRVNGGKSENA